MEGEVLSLRVCEVFHSLQGEGLTTGERTAFVRLSGCPLRCHYCDTTYAFAGGERISIKTILARVAAYQVRYVCVTGGEPLAQSACPDLLAALCDAGYAVSLETSGALDIGVVDPRVVKVVDIKTPGSGESHRWCESNLAHLRRLDQVKLVICDEADYAWAAAQVAQHRLDQVCVVLFSAAAGRLSPAVLGEWILRDRLPVRLQVQLHRLLWGEARGK